jgi:HEAT repeat protein
MGRIGDTRSVEPLIKTLDDDAPEVRWMAVHALGEIKDMKAFEPLTALLGDRDTGIASEANRSLERLQRKEEAPEPGLRPPDLDAQRPVIQRIHPVAPQGGMK